MSSTTLPQAAALRAHQKSLAEGQARLRAANSELTDAKERAEAASQAKSAFLANMSHELRTPLNAIIGYSEIIKSLTFGPQAIDRYAEYAGDINTAGAHLLKVINDVLDTASIEAGKLKLNEETVDLEEVVRQSLAPLRLLSERKRITIDTAVAEAPAVRADPLRLNQVFINLLSNALKFTPAGGHIYVEIAGDEHGGVIRSVRDTGSACLPSRQPRP